MKLSKLFALTISSILMTNAIQAMDPERLPEICAVDPERMPEALFSCDPEKMPETSFDVCAQGKEGKEEVSKHFRNKARWLKKHSCQMNWSNLQQFGQDTQDSITVNGGAKLNGTVVTNLVAVNGVLVGVNSNIGSIQANGKVSLHNTTVVNSVDVNGFLVASKSTFQGPISVSSDKVFIGSSTADLIYVRNTGNANQVVVVAKGATVNTIEFESGTGTVIQKGSSTVVGTVIGGTITVKE